MNTRKEYESMLSQEYRISDIGQLITHYRCKIEIGIFCVSWDSVQVNKKLAPSIHENQNKSP